MKLFDKIKRRARDVIRAAKGEPWGDLARPVEFIRTEAKVETYRHEHHTGPIHGSAYTRENVLAAEVEQAAKVMGLHLLRAGFIKLERVEVHDPLYHAIAPDAGPGYITTLEVKVIKPEQREGVRE